MKLNDVLLNFELICEVPSGISSLKALFIDLAIRGGLDNHSSRDVNGYPSHWRSTPANQLLESRSGNSKLIKGKLMESPFDGAFPGYSASGQDVWLDRWEHDGTAAILSAVGARCGKTFLARGKWSAIANTHIIWIPEKNFIPEYAMLILNNEKFWIRSGTAQPFVKVKATLEKHIAVPPLEEQRLILEKVSSFIQTCDQLKHARDTRDAILTAARKSANDAISTAQTQRELQIAWERIRENWEVMVGARESISSLRQLLVDLAIHGQLFEAKAIGSHGYPTTWEVSDFKSICNIEGGSQPPKSVFVSEPREGYVQLFQIRDLGPNPVPVFIPEELARSTAKEGEILIGRYGASVGKIFRAKQGAYNVALVKFIYPKDKLDSEFVYWFLKSSRSQALFTGMSRSAQAGFNKKDLAPLLIPIPSLTEQQEIIGKLNSLMEMCNQLEGSLLNASELAGKFAQSVSSVSA